jgi:hypothetical protein
MTNCEPKKTQPRLADTEKTKAGRGLRKPKVSTLSSRSRIGRDNEAAERPSEDYRQTWRVAFGAEADRAEIKMAPRRTALALSSNDQSFWMNVFDGLPLKYPFTLALPFSIFFL